MHTYTRKRVDRQSGRSLLYFGTRASGLLSGLSSRYSDATGNNPALTHRRVASFFSFSLPSPFLVLRRSCAAACRFEYKVGNRALADKGEACVAVEIMKTGERGRRRRERRRKQVARRGSEMRRKRERG